MGRIYGSETWYVHLFAITALGLTITLEHIKRSMQGKLAAATQVQSAEYLKPLFKLLRSRVSEVHTQKLQFLTFLSHYRPMYWDE